jgi:hypothetical protein
MRKLATVAILLTLAGPAVGQTNDGPRTAPSIGRFSLSPFVGTDASVGGRMLRQAEIRSPAAGNIQIAVGGPALNFLVPNQAAFTLHDVSFGKLYEAPREFGLSFAYGIVDGGEIFATARHAHAEPRNAIIGEIANNTTAGIVGGGINFTSFDEIRAKASAFNATTLEAGYRHFFRTGSSFTPYFAGSVGATYLPAVEVDLLVRNAKTGVNMIEGRDFSIGKMNLFDRTLAPTFGIEVGVTYSLTDQMTIGVETGLRYTARYSQNDSGIAHASAAGINDATERYSVPFRLTGRFAF